MPSVTAQLVTRSSAPFGPGTARSIQERVRQFQDAEKKAARSAAATATTTSRNSFKYLRPPGPQRPGRESTGGRFPDYLQWDVDARGQVALDLDELETKAPHWIILELGTGESAQMRVGGDETSVEGAGARSRIRTVRSQRGRRIHPAFVFAQGGIYSPPGAARNQQLVARQLVTGAPARRRAIVIKREINGQHFVKKGAQTGFRQYRQSVLTAAREAFRKGSAP